MGQFSKKIKRFLEADMPTPPTPAGGAMPPPPGMGGMGAMPPMGGGLGGLGGGLGGPGDKLTPGQGGGSPPETKFINVDDVWKALQGAVKDMDHYPDLKLKVSSRKRSPKDERKSSLETGD